MEAFLSVPWKSFPDTEVLPLACGLRWNSSTILKVAVKVTLVKIASGVVLGDDVDLKLQILRWNRVVAVSEAS